MLAVALALATAVVLDRRRQHRRSKGEPSNAKSTAKDSGYGTSGACTGRSQVKRSPLGLMCEELVRDAAAAVVPDRGWLTGRAGGAGGTSWSTVSEELHKAAFHIDPKDIVLKREPRFRLGGGAFGEARSSAVPLYSWPPLTYTNHPARHDCHSRTLDCISFTVKHTLYAPLQSP